MVSLLRCLLLCLTCLASPSIAAAQPTEGLQFLKLFTDWTKAFDRLDAVWSGKDPETKGCDACGKAYIETVEAKMDAAFVYLTGIVESGGWVTADVWGEAVEDAAIEIVSVRMLHTDRKGSEGAVAFAKVVAPNIRMAVEKRGADPKGYAIIVDNVELFEGRPQIYGSEFDCVGERFAPVSVIEPEKLDERRASIGLGPIAEHRYSRNAYLQDYCASIAVSSH